MPHPVFYSAEYHNSGVIELILFFSMCLESIIRYATIRSILNGNTVFDAGDNLKIAT